MPTLSAGAACPAASTDPRLRFHSIISRLGIALLAGSLLVAQPLKAHDYQSGDIRIEHPWSRATPEGAKVAVGYLTVKNIGSTADRLVRVESEFSGKAEIHQMAVDDKGVMTMRELADGVEIPAGAEVTLKPGGVHIMFMQIDRSARAGETFNGSLTFEKAGTIAVEFDVQAMSSAGQGTHDNHGG